VLPTFGALDTHHREVWLLSCASSDFEMTNKKLFLWTRKPGTQQACKTAFCGDTNTLFEADEVTGVTCMGSQPVLLGGTFWTQRETALFQVCLQDPCTVLRYNTPNTPARTHALVPCARTTRTRSHHAREWLPQRFLFLSALPRPPAPSLAEPQLGLFRLDYLS
jgi:hypothetical protein